MSDRTPIEPIIGGASSYHARVPGLVLHDFKPSGGVRKDPCLAEAIRCHLRPYSHAVVYPANRTFLGGMTRDQAGGLPRPCFQHSVAGTRTMIYGDIMCQKGFYGTVKLCDECDHIRLTESFVTRCRRAFARGEGARNGLDRECKDRRNKCVPPEVERVVGAASPPDEKWFGDLEPISGCYGSDLCLTRNVFGCGGRSCAKF